ncbi:threonine-phosphate decarboxylase CobD [Cytobacillus sp. FSL W7-1323]|uniref:threonine-phosphate decarboxylase CobD n=1 Tax=unclassified Cytobacillus TaxID=2675268 RepID=UPI002AFE3724|nr:threonine-phosphate decarboxylase CobD [Cytobacillus sp. OWB-43]MEA1854994.1 threonine-phosphate decarboxylase CobD [Cytobacillus sp. OWB-43]
MQWPKHGANPQYLYEVLKLDMPAKTIDFSANINPLGPPQAVKRQWSSLLSSLYEYPDPFATRLTERISKTTLLPKENVLIANGGAEIISMIGQLFARKRVMIVQPAFSEYETACRANVCEIDYFFLNKNWHLDIEGLIATFKEIDVVFLTNPNNPTGKYFSKDSIKRLIEAAECLGVYLIVDEAFYDFVDEYEPISPLLLQYDQLVIIRSMTKMFAIPGIRLGYVLANEQFITDLRAIQPHWSVNSVAQEIGLLCIEDNNFQKETRELMKVERKRIFSFLTHNDYLHSDSSTNFYLLKDPFSKESERLFLFLLEKGLIPRHTYNFPGLEGNWLRLAMKSPDENSRLMEALKRWRESSL